MDFKIDTHIGVEDFVKGLALAVNQGYITDVDAVIYLKNFLISLNNYLNKK